MKLIFFSLLFSGIVAIGVVCVTGLLPRYIESDLEIKAKQKVKENSNYSLIDIEMDHLHATKAVVETKFHVTDVNEESIKSSVLSIINSVSGIYADSCEVVVVRPDKNPVIENDITNSDSLVKFNNLNPPPSEDVEAALAYEPCSFSIVWNEHDGELLIKGKQTNEVTGQKIKEFFRETKKRIKVRNEIILDKELVSNSKYLQRSLRDAKLLIRNSVGDLHIEFQDALQNSHKKQKGFLRFQGTAGAYGTYDVLSTSLAHLVNEDFEVTNELAFYPDVTITKNLDEKKITLTGCVKDKFEQSMLASNAARDIYKDYQTDNKLTTHERCLAIRWHDESAENLIAQHMRNVSDGEIVYRHNELFKLSGKSDDSGYVDEVRLIYRDTNVAKDLIYDDSTRNDHSLNYVEPVTVESLAEQLGSYKIYFQSGEFNVDTRYYIQLEEIAEKILKSADKESQIIVGGYADTSGSASQNKRLSLKRAKAVLVLLVERGVDPERVQVEFFGAEATGRTKAESRRVEIKVRKK